jgi:tRNA (mo5U34)-methyltransferase
MKNMPQDLSTNVIDLYNENCALIYSLLNYNKCNLDLPLLIKKLNARKKHVINPNTLRFFEKYSLIDLPPPTSFDFCNNSVRIGDAVDIDNKSQKILIESLKGLMPWRKGPFELFGVTVDSEWQSNIKWNLIKRKIPDLKNKTVLDVGCNNGYYMFRLLELEPRIVLGIDPSDLYYFQFYFLMKLLKTYKGNNLANKLAYAPIGVNDITPFKKYFDCIFCMGILYHQRSPVDMLKTIKKSLNKYGYLILETLIIEGEDEVALFPKDTYAKMTNVNFIPTIKCLENFLFRAGFIDFEVISISKTKIDEQRPTKWSSTQSLADFLDKNDNTKTAEGYPAPIRACIKARCKN